MIVLRNSFPRIEVRKGDKESAWAAQSNGQNSLTRIWVWSGIDNSLGVLAQELFENRHRWVWGFLFGVLGAAIGGTIGHFSGVPTFYGLAALLGFMGFLIGPRLGFVQRRKELISHEIEVQVGVQYNSLEADALRRKEAEGMVRYDWLSKLSPDQVYNGMASHKGRALKWIKANRSFLDKADKAIEGMNAND